MLDFTLFFGAADDISGGDGTHPNVRFEAGAAGAYCSHRASYGRYRKFSAYKADGTAMSPMSHAFNEYSLMGTCIRLAQSTFQQAMPASLPVVIPAPVASEPREGFWHRLAESIDNWFYRQQVKEREAYFAQAQDIFDLENRLREYDRRTSL